MPTPLSKKQIPTLLGLAVLVVGMIAGVAFLGVGFGAFSPRATAQTAPKNLQISNVTDAGFTISFLTDDSTVGFVKYGTAPNALKLQTSDDRDQLAGSVSPYTSHYITVRDVQPATTYYFDVGTGSAVSDNNGQPYTVKTATHAGNPGAAQTIFGSILGADGKPAGGAIVYAQIPGVGMTSSLVKDSGSWSIPLSNARTTDGSAYATIDPNATVTLLVQGTAVSDQTTKQLTIAQAQPASPVTMAAGGGGAGSTASDSANLAQTGGSGFSVTGNDQTGGTAAADQTAASPTPDTGAAIQVPANTTSPTPAPPSALAAQAVPSPAPDPARVVNVQDNTKINLNTTQPIIVGTAPANVHITVEIHSTNPITTQVQTNDTGGYSLDLSQLSKTLAPGTHTITISYVDPQTGKTVSQKKTFTVAATATAAPSPTPDTTQTLALASTQPYGSSNPYSIDTATPIATATAQYTMPSTASGTLTTGSVGTTFAIVLAGLFLLTVGTGSWIVSKRNGTME